MKRSNIHMKFFRSGSSRIAGMALFSGLIMLGISAVAFGHGEGEPDLGGVTPGEGSGETGMFISESLGRTLGNIRSLMDKNQYQEAVNRLETLEQRSDSYNRYENAVVHQTLAYAYASINDYAQATEAFAEALSFKALSRESTLAVMQNLGQLYIVTEEYEKGITILENWMALAQPKDIAPHMRVLLGNAYLHQKDYAKAVAQLKQAVTEVDQPNKTWLQILASTYQQWGHYGEMAEVLQQAVIIYPEEKAFWQQLVAAYRQANDDKQAAAALALSCNAGLCDEKDITYLARLYLYLGAPVSAAHLIDAALRDGRMPDEADNWKLLAQSWQQARETDKATTAYIEAAKRTKISGDADYRLGQIYVQQEKWQPAAAALAEALRKGQLSSVGRAQLMLGVSHYYLGHTEQALTAVEAAVRYPDVEKEARRWLQQLRAMPAAENRKG